MRAVPVWHSFRMLMISSDAARSTISPLTIISSRRFMSAGVAVSLSFLLNCSSAFAAVVAINGVEELAHFSRRQGSKLRVVETRLVENHFQRRPVHANRIEPQHFHPLCHIAGLHTIEKDVGGRIVRHAHRQVDEVVGC